MADTVDILLREFRAGEGPAAAIRAAARERFASSGLPTPRAEQWKFTNLRPLDRFLADAAPAAAEGTADIPAPLVEGAWQVVLVDGRVTTDLSAIAEAGLEIAPLSEDSLVRLGGTGNVHPVRDLSLAMATETLSLRVSRGATLARPVEILFLATGTRPASHVVMAIDLGEMADATLVERHVGPGGGLLTVAGHVRVGDGARLRHIKVQDAATEAFHLAITNGEAGRDAVWERFVLSVGARLARDEVDVLLGATGAEVRLLGAAVGRGNQHLDHTTRIDHAVPRTTSHEVYKTVLDDSARGVFQGSILVRKDAQKTSGHQLNRALLLSPKAEMDSKPALEIFADDVKCSHGATTGDLDEVALFYLRSRGVPMAEARALLVQAFLDEVFDGVDNQDLRAALLGRVHAALGRPGEDARG
ncbi:MAG: Fe-S cluster assembly protein SufD [Pseudomonadota bacterium]|nr:Fe-S cluster assembly protein SufD [Pseudomonadota bacterium]